MAKMLDEYTDPKLGAVVAVTSEKATGSARVVDDRGRRSIVRLGPGGDADLLLRSLVGERVVIEVERDGVPLSMAAITFGGADSSLQVHFPYFGATRAVFANLTLQKHTADGYTYEFQSDRIDVCDPADLKGFKLSHKSTTGYVDFNRWKGADEKACGPWRRGLPLATGFGRVAEASVYEVSGLRLAKAPKVSDVHVRFRIPKPWSAVSLRIDWETLERISNRTDGAGPIGPIGAHGGSEPALFAFVRAPAPHADRVAQISVRPVGRPKGDGSVMIVLAGFAKPDVPPEKPGVCLGAIYVIDAHPCCLKRAT